ncbi:hypothetical protein D3C72_457610 [compost metagenome]|jgi:hypothetical protein
MVPLSQCPIISIILMLDIENRGSDPGVIWAGWEAPGRLQLSFPRRNAAQQCREGVSASEILQQNRNPSRKDDHAQDGENGGRADQQK